MKRMFASFTLLGVLAAFAAPGCGGDENQTSSGTTPQDIALDNLGTEMAKIFCEMAYSCCDATELAKLLGEIANPPPMSQAECETILKGAFDSEVLTGLKEGVNAGRLEYDGALARTCAGSLEGQCSL